MAEGCEIRTKKRGLYVRLAPDRGSASLLAVGLIGATATLTGILIPFTMALVTRQAVAGAADAAALAAADVASGRVAGVPCELALLVVEANGASMAVCEVDGLVVTVTATTSTLGIAIPVTATAGPPRRGVD
jgi:secretion/DNA translocation related TadE-like protein